jgi:hypothetical protein
MKNITPLVSLGLFLSGALSAHAETLRYELPYGEAGRKVRIERDDSDSVWKILWPSQESSQILIRSKNISLASCKTKVAWLVDEYKKGKSNEGTLKNLLRGQNSIRKELSQIHWQVSEFKPLDPVFLKAQKQLGIAGSLGLPQSWEDVDGKFSIADPQLEFKWTEDAYSKALGVAEIESFFTSQFNNASALDYSFFYKGELEFEVPYKDLLCDLLEGKLSISLKFKLQHNLEGFSYPYSEEDLKTLFSGLQNMDRKYSSLSGDKAELIRAGYLMAAAIERTPRFKDTNDKIFLKLYSSFFESADNLKKSSINFSNLAVSFSTSNPIKFAPEFKVGKVGSVSLESL